MARRRPLFVTHPPRSGAHGRHSSHGSTPASIVAHARRAVPTVDVVAFGAGTVAKAAAGAATDHRGAAHDATVPQAARVIAPAVGAAGGPGLGSGSPVADETGPGDGSGRSAVGDAGRGQGASSSGVRGGPAKDAVNTGDAGATEAASSAAAVAARLRLGSARSLVEYLLLLRSRRHHFQTARHGLGEPRPRTPSRKQRAAQRLAAKHKKRALSEVPAVGAKVARPQHRRRGRHAWSLSSPTAALPQAVVDVIREPAIAVRVEVALAAAAMRALAHCLGVLLAAPDGRAATVAEPARGAAAAAGASAVATVGTTADAARSVAGARAPLRGRKFTTDDDAVALPQFAPPQVGPTQRPAASGAAAALPLRVRCVGPPATGSRADCTNSLFYTSYGAVLQALTPTGAVAARGQGASQSSRGTPAADAAANLCMLDVCAVVRAPRCVTRKHAPATAAAQLAFEGTRRPLMRRHSAERDGDGRLNIGDGPPPSLPSRRVRSAPRCCVVQGLPHVFYIGTDSCIHELFLSHHPQQPSAPTGAGSGGSPQPEHGAGSNRVSLGPGWAAAEPETGSAAWPDVALSSTPPPPPGPVAMASRGRDSSASAGARPRAQSDLLVGSVAVVPTAGVQPPSPARRALDDDGAQRTSQSSASCDVSASASPVRAEARSELSATLGSGVPRHVVDAWRGAWRHRNLSELVPGAARPWPGMGPLSLLTEGGRCHVYYIADSGSVHELVYMFGKWSHFELTRLATHPKQGRPPAAFALADTFHSTFSLGLLYLGADTGMCYRLQYRLFRGWSWQLADGNVSSVQHRHEPEGRPQRAERLDAGAAHCDNGAGGAGMAAVAGGVPPTRRDMVRGAPAAHPTTRRAQPPEHSSTRGCSSPPIHGADAAGSAPPRGSPSSAGVASPPHGVECSADSPAPRPSAATTSPLTRPNAAPSRTALRVPFRMGSLAAYRAFSSRLKACCEQVIIAAACHSQVVHSMDGLADAPLQAQRGASAGTGGARHQPVHNGPGHDLWRVAVAATRAVACGAGRRPAPGTLHSEHPAPREQVQRMQACSHPAVDVQPVEVAARGVLRSLQMHASAAAESLADQVLHALSRTDSSGDAHVWCHAVFEHGVSPTIGIMLRHVQPHEWGKSTHSTAAVRRMPRLHTRAGASFFRVLTDIALTNSSVCVRARARPWQAGAAASSASQPMQIVFGAGVGGDQVAVETVDLYDVMQRAHIEQGQVGPGRRRSARTCY